MFGSIPSWLIISAVIVIVVIVLIRMMDQIYILALLKENFFYIFLLLVLIFLTIFITGIHTHNKIDLTSTEGVKNAAKIYYTSFANIFSNIGKVTGYALQQSWMPSNSTNAAVKKPK
jgi:hypothetical protein